MDDNSHGTHVSGTIAAAANNSLGVAGVNWSCSIMALKFLDSSGSGYLSDAIRAINYATMMRTQYGVNVRVMNNSWGGGNYSSAHGHRDPRRAAADILFVAAAGNDATNNDASPAISGQLRGANVISVAAIDQNKNLASFSCYGAIDRRCRRAGRLHLQHRSRQSVCGLFGHEHGNALRDRVWRRWPGPPIPTPRSPKSATPSSAASIRSPRSRAKSPAAASSTPTTRSSCSPLSRTQGPVVGSLAGLARFRHCRRSVTLTRRRNHRFQPAQ